jgi:hypothetical protein
MMWCSPIAWVRVVRGEEWDEREAPEWRNALRAEPMKEVPLESVAGVPEVLKLHRPLVNGA